MYGYVIQILNKCNCEFKHVQCMVGGIYKSVLKSYVKKCPSFIQTNRTAFTKIKVIACVSKH